jgi:hypothetical protein
MGRQQHGADFAADAIDIKPTREQPSDQLGTLLARSPLQVVEQPKCLDVTVVRVCCHGVNVHPRRESTACTAAVAAAERLGRAPPAVLTAVAAMTDEDLVEHRNRFAPRPKAALAGSRLVESDRLRVAADRWAREAEQDKGRTPKRPLRLLGLRLNNPARAITEARERARAVEAQAARKDIERAAARQAFIS